MMKAYMGEKKKFTGGWEENLDGFFAVFDMMARICRLTENERPNSISIMLDGDALRLFSYKGSEFLTHADATELLR